ncbi:MAG: SH3 domain-containing protein [Pseudomonadota bacterium]
MKLRHLKLKRRSGGKVHGFNVLPGVLVSAMALTWSPVGTLNAEDMFTKENVGKAIGAVTGALIGSQIGGGSGKVAAVAVGTLAGYWIGGEIGRSLSEQDRAGIAQTTEQALETGESQAWQNPETGVYTKVSVHDDTGSSSRLSRLQESPLLEHINAYYVASSNVNVRGGPGTKYEILHGLKRGERVPVVGKVVDRDWYMIAEGGQGSGFVYAPLLARSEGQPVAGNAVRDATQGGNLPQTYAVAESECRRITQEVRLPSGERQQHSFRACRQADGKWVEV